MTSRAVYRRRRLKCAAIVVGAAAFFGVAGDWNDLHSHSASAADGGATLIPPLVIENPTMSTPTHCLDSSEFSWTYLRPPGWACTWPTAPVATGPTSTVRSTEYCLAGIMANGHRVHDGAVAMNGVPFGTRYRIESGPQAGKVVTVEDHYAYGTQFDIWVASCSAARTYGRHTITVTRLS